MKIMVSACLLGENCKYNGGNNFSEKVMDFLEGHEIIPVCPEVSGGLTVPRTPSEIVNGVVMASNGRDVDLEFRTGAEICLKKALEENVDLVILKSKSPSCGVKQIYDGTFSGRLIEGQGVFARLMTENAFHVMDEEDL